MVRGNLDKYAREYVDNLNKKKNDPKTTWLEYFVTIFLLNS